MVELEEILTDKQIYFKDPAFTKATGKPWVEADISELSTKVGVSLGSLLQNLESADPLDQTKLFTASKNAHVVGTTMLNGVSTTEYAGTYAPKVALAELSPKLRKIIGPTLRTIGANPVQFEVWIDAQHVVRRAIDTNNVHGRDRDHDAGRHLGEQARRTSTLPLDHRGRAATQDLEHQI